MKQAEEIPRQQAVVGSLLLLGSHSGLKDLKRAATSNEILVWTHLSLYFIRWERMEVTWVKMTLPFPKIANPPHSKAGFVQANLSTCHQTAILQHQTQFSLYTSVTTWSLLFVYWSLTPHSGQKCRKTTVWHSSVLLFSAASKDSALSHCYHAIHVVTGLRITWQKCREFIWLCLQ